MDISKVDIQIWLWCAAATSLVAMAGASLGPVRLDPPATRSTLDARYTPSAAGPARPERRADDPAD